MVSWVRRSAQKVLHSASDNATLTFGRQPRNQGPLNHLLGDATGAYLPRFEYIDAIPSKF